VKVEKSMYLIKKFSLHTSNFHLSFLLIYHPGKNILEEKVSFEQYIIRMTQNHNVFRCSVSLTCVVSLCLHGVINLHANQSVKEFKIWTRITTSGSRRL